MAELIEMPYGTGKTVGIWRTICLPSYPPQYRYECSKCSVCSKEMSNYCPHCGAEMQFLEKNCFPDSPNGVRGALREADLSDFIEVRKKQLEALQRFTVINSETE